MYRQYLDKGSILDFKLQERQCRYRMDGKHFKPISDTPSDLNHLLDLKATCQIICHSLFGTFFVTTCLFKLNLNRKMDNKLNSKQNKITKASEY